MKDKLDRLVAASKQDMIRDIKELVSIPSVTGQETDIRRALDWVMSRAQEMGFETKMTTHEDVGIVEMGQGDETIGVLVHVDIVGIGDRGKWNRDPFESYEEGGYLWGRGTIDDKGPVMMALYAMKALKEAEVLLTKKIQLIVGTSEESSWTDMRHFIMEFPLPDFGFSPDGEFPIFNIEKGYADVELYFREPGIKNLQRLFSGDSPNTIPSSAFVQFADGTQYRADGVSAHSSVPDAGDNAIIKLCMEMPGGEGYGFCRFIRDVFSGAQDGRKLGLDDGQEYYEGHYVGRTTAAPTMLQLTGQGVTLNLNIRHRYPVESGELLATLQKYGDQYGFACAMKECLTPMMVDEKQEHLQTMRQVAESYGCDGSFQVADGTSYAKSMKNCVSWGPVFPGDESGAHEENERLSLDSMLLATKMYTYYLFKTATDADKLERLDKMSSLERGLMLLELFEEPPHRFSVMDVVKKTAMNRTTVYRNLTALEQRGYLTKDEKGKDYKLGPMNYMLGMLYLSSGNYEERLYNLLEEIGKETKESVGMARRDGDKVVSIYSVEAHQEIKVMNDKQGTFYPMNKGTYGKCLMAYHERPVTAAVLSARQFEKTAPNTLTTPEEILAEYRKIREQGYVLSIEETVSYVIGVGVPLKGKDNRVNNVVAVSFFKREDYLEKIEQIKSVLFAYKPKLEKFLL